MTDLNAMDPNRMDRAQLVAHVLKLRSLVARLRQRNADERERQQIADGQRCPRCGSTEPVARWDLCASCNTETLAEIAEENSRPAVADPGVPGRLAAPRDGISDAEFDRLRQTIRGEP